MSSVGHPQARKLDQLIRAASCGHAAAERGLLFCSGPGLALVNAAFDLFECDALYDLAADVSRELASGECERAGRRSRCR